MNGKLALLGASLFFVLITLTACNGDGTTAAPLPSPSPSPPSGPQVSAIALPKTEQTTCHEPNGTAQIINCANTGQDGDHQAGIPIPNPRYTVDGECVTDNLTGLMWARNANLPAGDSAPTQPVAGKRTWQEALDFANSLDLCGFSDWRLPNRLELRSHVGHQTPINAIRLTNSGFVNVGSEQSFDYSYWSSTSNVGNASVQAYIVSLQFGAMRPIEKTEVNYVWPVRTGPTSQSAPGQLSATGQTTCSDINGAAIDCANTGQDGEHQAGVAWPNPRFTVGTGDTADCVTDNLTGLMWMRTPNNFNPASVNWGAALTNSNEFALCGYSDWRLPNVRELESLLNSGVADGASYLNDQGFSGVQGTPYWTSTSRAYSGERDPAQLPAWTVSLDGSMNHEVQKGLENAFWPVRGGQ